MMRIASAGKENGQSKRQKGILWQQTLDEELFSPLAPLTNRSRREKFTVPLKI
jgi:hypothetical protein